MRCSGREWYLWNPWFKYFILGLWHLASFPLAADWQGAKVATSALLPKAAARPGLGCVNHLFMQAPVLLQSGCQSTLMLVTLMTIHSQEGSLCKGMHCQQHGHAALEPGASAMLQSHTIAPELHQLPARPRYHSIMWAYGWALHPCSEAWIEA